MQRIYSKSKSMQLNLKSIKSRGEYASIKIPHMDQNIQKHNFDVMLYVLKESLRDIESELIITEKKYSSGFDSIIGAFGKNCKCWRYKDKNVDYKSLKDDQIVQDQYINNFKKKLENLFNISPDKVEILDISYEQVTVISFIIKDDQDIILNNNQFLEQLCENDISLYHYFYGAEQIQSLSIDDFDPLFNFEWGKSFPESIMRGPKQYQYDYYPPKGCYGFGLNVKKYGQNQNWMKMDGNDEEWRILYHGTSQNALVPIIKQNLKPGENQIFQAEVGKGIYFADKIENARPYAKPVKVGDKLFKLYFMSRCNPKAIKQCPKMKELGYYLVSNSQDVRPYRILIEEVLDNNQISLKYVL